MRGHKFSAWTKGSNSNINNNGKKQKRSKKQKQKKTAITRCLSYGARTATPCKQSTRSCNRLKSKATRQRTPAKTQPRVARNSVRLQLTPPIEKIGRLPLNTSPLNTYRLENEGRRIENETHIYKKGTRQMTETKVAARLGPTCTAARNPPASYVYSAGGQAGGGRDKPCPSIRPKEGFAEGRGKLRNTNKRITKT